MHVEQLVDRKVTKETEVLGEKLFWCRFIHHKSNMT
jgi:hypothetical protein